MKVHRVTCLADAVIRETWDITAPDDWEPTPENIAEALAANEDDLHAAHVGDETEGDETNRRDFTVARGRP